MFRLSGQLFISSKFLQTKVVKILAIDRFSVVSILDHPLYRFDNVTFNENRTALHATLLFVNKARKCYFIFFLFVTKEFLPFYSTDPFTRPTARAIYLPKNTLDQKHTLRGILL